MEHPVPRYSWLAHEFVVLLDQGQSMTVDETKSSIRDGSLFERLREQHPGFDVSTYEPTELETILNVFGSLADEVDEDRKLGISHNGLALCLAYCIEVLRSPMSYAGDDG